MPSHQRADNTSFSVGFNSHELNEDAKTLVRDHKVGNIILFQRNVASIPQLLRLTNSLQELARSSGHTQPLFISIDQENGLVTRIKPPIAAQLPGSMTLGATGDASDAFQVASATAETLKSFGINMTYCCVADVNSEPRNPIIGVRSFSDDPETVGRFVSAQIKAIQSGGIVPCVKHFPGHGDTAVDSHYGLPIITKSKLDMDLCELVPFRRAVLEGVDTVMTAHIALPNLKATKAGSNNLPASLNPDAISILREEMKFEGLILSDCLTMDGVRATYGTERSAVMALKAGIDCVMVRHTLSQVGAIEQVIQAVRSGELSQEAIEASVKRVETLKSKYLPSFDVKRKATQTSTELRNSQQSKLAEKIYAKSTTVVRSESGRLPITTDHSAKIVLMTPSKAHLGGGIVESVDEPSKGSDTPSPFMKILQRYNPSVLEEESDDGIPFSPETEKLIEEADTVILATRNANITQFQRDMGLHLGKKLGRKLIVIATCDPYDFLEDSEIIKNYITIYEPTIPAFKAAADVMFGKTNAQGKLPVASQATRHHVLPYEHSNENASKIWQLWKEIFPEWPILQDRLEMMLASHNSRHYIHEHGFCLAYHAEDGIGRIACVGVLPAYRRKGIGSALISAARKQLSSDESVKSLSLGSLSPRLWPRVPATLASEYKEFFLHRGFRKSGSNSQDLYRDISTSVATPEILSRISSLPFKIAPWSPDLYEECITKIRANFESRDWVPEYEAVGRANLYHEVMVAFDSVTNEQVAWMLMCSPSTPLCQCFALLPAMPSGEETGLMACVGVDENVRGNGAGMALVVRAMEDLKRRGLRGVMVNWVGNDVVGFYERMGFGTVWEYEGWEW